MQWVDGCAQNAAEADLPAMVPSRPAGYGRKGIEGEGACILVVAAAVREWK